MARPRRPGTVFLVALLLLGSLWEHTTGAEDWEGGADDEGMPDQAPVPPPTKLAFVAHHGLLARSYRFVADTHKKFAFDVLAQAGYRVETFVHSWDLKTPIYNPRAQEPSVMIRPAEEVVKDVPFLTEWLIEDQAESLEGRNVRDYVFNTWIHDQPATKENYVRALVSLSRVWALMEKRANETGREPDLVLYLRPDIMLAGPLPLDQLFEVNGVCWRRDARPNSRELGDRLMYGSFRAMKAYGTRINIASSPEFKSTGCWDLAECAADFSVREFKDKGCPMPMSHIGRVRTNGRLNDLDRRAMLRARVPLGKFGRGRMVRRPRRQGQARHGVAADLLHGTSQRPFVGLRERGAEGLGGAELQQDLQDLRGGAYSHYGSGARGRRMSRYRHHGGIQHNTPGRPLHHHHNYAHRARAHLPRARGVLHARQRRASRMSYPQGF